jgi:hypothetical protein
MRNVRHYCPIKSTGPGAAAASVTGYPAAHFENDAFGHAVRATGPKTAATDSSGETH